MIGFAKLWILEVMYDVMLKKIKIKYNLQPVKKLMAQEKSQVIMWTMASKKVSTLWNLKALESLIYGCNFDS